MSYPVLDPDGRFERLARDYDRAMTRGERDLAHRILAAHAAGMIAAEHDAARWDGSLIASNDVTLPRECGCDLCDAGVAT